jgi:HPt (histidine-containing phosphotransfer) domain-containing protein
MARLIADTGPSAIGAGFADRPVDLVHLARQTLGDKSLELEVLALFERQSTILLNRLDSASDSKAWRDAAHTLKGSAQGIGAWRVARTAESVEKCQGERGSPAASDALDALRSAVAEANATIRNLVARA